MKPLPVNMLAFECAILKADKPVLVVFGAYWDYGSRQLFEQIEWCGKTLDGKLITARADIEYVPELFYEYNILELPTMIIFEDGEPFKPYVGFHNLGDIDKYLDSFFGYRPYVSIFPNYENNS